jgi:hypothetical protein
MSLTAKLPKEKNSREQAMKERQNEILMKTEYFSLPARIFCVLFVQLNRPLTTERLKFNSAERTNERRKA